MTVFSIIIHAAEIAAGCYVGYRLGVHAEQRKAIIKADELADTIALQLVKSEQEAERYGYL